MKDRKHNIFFLLVVCFSLGVVTNIVLFFSAVFILAGDDGSVWVSSYFSSYNGKLFSFISVLIGLFFLPFVLRVSKRREVKGGEK